MEIPAKDLTPEVEQTATSAPAEALPLPPAAPSPPAPREERLVGSHDPSHARQTLEALRLGVVPAIDLSAYTVGRDKELAVVDGDLATVASRGGAVRTFLGDYGSGKTHLLELAQHRALAQGYLTAMVALDQEETAPSHPKRVYRALVRALRYPERPFEEGAGLRPLLEKAAASPGALSMLGIAGPQTKGTLADLEARLDSGFHLYLSAAVHAYQKLSSAAAKRTRRKPVATSGTDATGDSLDLLEDWIEGHPTISNQVIDAQLARFAGRHLRIYSLLDFRPWARIYGYLLSGLSALARAVGYRGLVILLDEAEFYALLSKENRAFADHLFKSWTFAAIGGLEAGAGAKLPFDAGDIEIGGYGIQQRLPGRYGKSPGLYLVLAMTPSPDGVAALGGAVPSDCLTDLAALGHDDYLALSARICDFYASAHADWSLPGKLVEPLGKVLSGLIRASYVSNPRHAMKFLIEFLDIVRYQPGKVATMVRDLQSQVAW